MAPKKAADLEEVPGSKSASESESASEGGDPPPAPELNIHERATRVTAGQVFNVREGKEKEDDDAFWGHEDFQDCSDDSDVEFSEKAVESSNDSSDADIDASSEDAPAEEAPGAAEAAAQKIEEEQRRRLRKKIFVPGAKATQKPVPRAKAPPGDAEAGDEERKAKKKAAPAASAPVDRARRKTTRHAADDLKERLAEREAEKEHTVKRPRNQAPRLTQMERLDIAKLTETKNLKEFQAMKSLEDDARKRTRHGLQRKRYLGPRTRVVSRQDGNGRVVNFVDFVGCDLPPACAGLQRYVMPLKPRCAVTGLPARYRDPLTNLFFASAAAFAKIRSDEGAGM